MPLGAFKAALMGTAGVSTGDVVLLNTITASSDTTVSFTSGVDSTYGEYIFSWYDVGPETNEALLTVNFSTDGGSNYNMTKTSTFFNSEHRETGAGGQVQYLTSGDIAQGTGAQRLTGTIGNVADESAAGTLHLFNPSSTTYVKHFYSRSNNYEAANYTQDVFVAGYVNSTSDIDAVQFAMTSGDFDGKFKMWGVK